MPAGASPARGRRLLRGSGRRPLRSRAADVQRGPLVRVLPVTEHLAPGPQRRGHVRPAGLLRRLVRRVRGGEPGGDRAVVRGGVRVGAGGQPAPLLQGEPAAGHRRRDVPVPGRVGDDRDMLRGSWRPPGPWPGPPMSICSTHSAGGAPLRTAASNGYRLDTSSWNGAMPSSSSRAWWAGWPRSASSPACTAGCSVLTRPSRRLREPGEVLHPGHRDARGADRVRGAAGADDLHPRAVQRARQLTEPRLVVHADQRPPDRYPRQRPVLTFTARSLPSCPP